MELPRPPRSLPPTRAPLVAAPVVGFARQDLRDVLNVESGLLLLLRWRPGTAQQLVDGLRLHYALALEPLATIQRLEKLRERGLVSAELLPMGLHGTLTQWALTSMGKSVVGERANQLERLLNLPWR